MAHVNICLQCDVSDLRTLKKWTISFGAFGVQLIYKAQWLLWKKEAKVAVELQEDSIAGTVKKVLAKMYVQISQKTWSWARRKQFLWDTGKEPSQ